MSMNSNQTVKCAVTKCHIFIEDSGDVEVYGFDVYDSSSSELLFSVTDIFTDEERIRWLSQLINESNVADVHIMDIIFDAII